jgi:twitching motility protein PilU
MSERQRAEFAKELECNFALAIPDLARYRVNVFVQQLNVGMVIRTIPNEMPSFEQLGLPETFKEIVMTKRGMVLVVGATGSGKTTSLAAMIDHRNRSSAGHIITIEDPVEFVHQSQMSLVTHRDVGIDTHTWHHALKNTLRQAPDVILIGEIRDAETMEHAIPTAPIRPSIASLISSRKSAASKCSWIFRAISRASFRNAWCARKTAAAASPPLRYCSIRRLCPISF